MLQAKGLPRSGRKRRSQTGTRLETGLLIHAQGHLRLNKWTGVEVRQCMDELSKLLVARHFCSQPEMMLPGLEQMRSENPSNGSRRNALGYPICFEFAGQFRAIPVRQGTSYLVRSFVSDFDNVEGDFGRKNWDTARSRLLR